MTDNKKVYTKLVEISPSDAARILDAAKDKFRNRKINPSHVRALVSDMKKGNWHSAINGDTISFNEDGILNDGQHRMMAVVLSETTQTFLAAFNVPDDSIKSIDCGLKRSINAKAFMKGIPMEYGADSVLKRLLILRKQNKSFNQSCSSHSMSEVDMINELQRNYDRYNDAVRFGKGIVSKSYQYMGYNVIGAIYLYLIEIGYKKEIVEDFFNKFDTFNLGGKLFKTATYALSKARGNEKLNIYIKAFNSYILGYNTLRENLSTWFIPIEELQISKN